MIGAPCSSFFIAENSTNWQDDVSWQTSVECAAVLRAKARQLSRPVDGMPQLMTMRLGPDDSSKDRQPAHAAPANVLIPNARTALGRVWVRVKAVVLQGCDRCSQAAAPAS